MFNGIIFNTGTVKAIKKNKKSRVLSIFTKIPISKKEIGSSISCSGVCLTLISYQSKLINFYLSSETLSKSNMSKLKIGDNVIYKSLLNIGIKYMVILYKDM